MGVKAKSQVLPPTPGPCLPFPEDPSPHAQSTSSWKSAHLVSYLLVPTSNLKVGAKLRGPSWKPFSMGQVVLAMLSCEDPEGQNWTIAWAGKLRARAKI